MKYIQSFLLIIISFQAFSQTAYNFYDNQILASSYDINYTMGDFNKGLCFGEFLLGQQLTYTEKNAAIKEATAWFNQNPHETLKTANVLYQTMSQVYSINDALQIELARNMLLSDVYTSSIQSGEPSVLITLIQKYVQILEVDQVNHLVLTQQNIEGYINVVRISALFSGQQFNPSNADLAAAKQEIRKTFLNGNLEQKQSLCVMDTYYNIIVINYNNMASAQQEQLKQQYTQQYQYPQNTQQQNNNSSTDGNFYNMLSNMSLGNHAAMMNSIEAIGGSGNYWYVK